LLEQFLLQDAIDSFSNGILQRIPIFGHADLYMLLFEQVHIHMTAVLNASVGQ
jgi:hypothetical protein